MKQAISNINGLDELQQRFIYAVAKHETGNFTSNVFKSFNNAFGMRPAKKRFRYYTGISQSNYTIYNSIEDSVMDFVDWFQSKQLNVPREAWGGVQLMKKHGYFEDSFDNYFNAVNKYYHE